MVSTVLCLQQELLTSNYLSTCYLYIKHNEKYSSHSGIINNTWGSVLLDQLVNCSVNEVDVQVKWS